MNLTESLQKKKTVKPAITKGSHKNPYVLIGSIDHGHQIPDEDIPELINTLDEVLALKIEGSENALKLFHPMSTEILTKATVGLKPVSYLPESNEHNIGHYLINYGISEELAEVYVPSMFIRNNNGDINADSIFECIFVLFEDYKERFRFINTNRAMDNFEKIMKYWVSNDLDANDLDHFSFDFEKFMGDVREFEFWQPDLEKFREDFPGKIAVCVGHYHTAFIQAFLEGQKINKPEWRSHIDTRRDDKYSPMADANSLRQIYAHIDKAINS